MLSEPSRLSYLLVTYGAGCRIRNTRTLCDYIILTYKGYEVSVFSMDTWPHRQTIYLDGAAEWIALSYEEEQELVPWSSEGILNYARDSRRRYDRASIEGEMHEMWSK